MKASPDLRWILLGGAVTTLAVAVAGGVNLFYPQFAAGPLDALSALLPGFERTSTPRKVLKLAAGIGLYAALLMWAIRLVIRRAQK